MKKQLTKPSVYIPMAVLCCVLWSSAFPFIKLGYRYFEIAADDYASQILFAGCRFMLAGVITLILASIITKEKLIPEHRSTMGRIAALSLAQTAVQYTLFYISLAKIEGSSGSVINSAGTFFCVLLSAAVFRGSDKLTVPKILGCLLGFGGIVLMNYSTLHLGSNLAGEGLMLLSAMSYALSSILIKIFSEHDNPALLSGWQFFVGGLMMMGAGMAFGGDLRQVNGKAVAILIYLAFVSAAAYTLWGVLLKFNAVSKIAVFGFVIPVGGVILSALLLGESINIPLSTACLVLVSAGIVLVNVKQNYEK
ncbi:MAG: DMT family transporter [Clostridia bacterium]|nr:DMT family transporter [Clostridia bacterium]